MDIKYIITKINNNIICSQYTGDDCQSLNIADTGSLTGNIYIGRVKTSTLLLLKSRIKSNATIPLIVIRIAYTLILKITIK